MKLIIVHYHLRPGGIRRIIELATPHLARQLDGKVDCVTLACGEADDRGWNDDFVRQLEGTPVEFFVEPAFNYLSEQCGPPATLRRQIRRALEKLLADCLAKNSLIWAHNLGIARNLLLARELVRASAERGIPLVAHHHDWWFDNRWMRWPEMRRFGFRTLKTAAKTVFAAQRNLHHLAINHADARLLQRHFPARSGWLPNLTERFPDVPPDRLRQARAWLRQKMNVGDAPVWIIPCRLLRRKNVAEALLLKRWLRPDGWLITTGGVSSADEEDYAQDLQAAANRHHWKLRLGVLQGNERNKPGVTELLAASEVVLLTSIQEGFGLPYLEAAAARRPLIARIISNVAPDLQQFGFRFAQYYREILIDPRLFNWRAEQQRQRRLFRAWRQRLPAPCQGWVGEPALLAAGKAPAPVPFSRLTLTAQLEVVAQPRELSWDWCAPLNPFLELWRKRAAAGCLEITPWPTAAPHWLSGPAYARRFLEIISTRPARAPSPGSGWAAQIDFMRQKLGSDHLFPLLWAKRT